MPPRSDQPIRVMLVDDYPGMHPALTRLLTPACEIVGSVTEHTHILDEATRLQPDVVVLDLRMPGSSGLDMCQRLKAALPALRILLYSANDDDLIKHVALKVGAADFVSKNHLAEDLLPAIRRAVQS